VTSAIALWVAKGITGLMGNNTEGLSSQALQLGGIGMLLTTLIITMPTVAAALWQESMGTFIAYSAFGTAGASSAAPGPQGSRLGRIFASTAEVTTLLQKPHTSC